MKTRLSFLRRLAFTGAAAFLLTAGANRAHAVFIFTLQEVGNNVTIIGSGSLALPQRAPPVNPILGGLLLCSFLVQPEAAIITLMS